MKSVVQKIAAGCLALLVLGATMSFTVGMHFCGKTLVNYSLFTEVESCGMEMMQVPEIESCSIVVDNCCMEEHLTFEGQDILKSSWDQLKFQQQVFVASFSYGFLQIYKGENTNTHHFLDYSPPFLVRDIHILYEIFLL
ncbi:MAG: hypothetical protein R3299_08815 [Arenibacter sp.]|nr:hypothetical protein [Arenibacter sp.]